MILNERHVYRESARPDGPIEVARAEIKSLSLLRSDYREWFNLFVTSFNSWAF